MKPNEKESIQKILDDVMKMKPPFIIGMNLDKVGEDHVGEPAIWVRVVVTDKEANKKTFFKDTEPFVGKIRGAFQANDIDRWVYTIFVSEKEEKNRKRRAARELAQRSS